MTYYLALEAIGDDMVQIDRMWRTLLPKEMYQLVACAPTQPWVARITGLDPKYGFAREFQGYKKDYRHTNKAGSRGVYKRYFLDDGIYEVNDRQSWRSTVRYFIVVSHSKAGRIEKRDVEALFGKQRACGRT
jgi:hypothetical protein